MGIKHRADSGFRKFSALSKLYLGRTVKCFEMPYVSYPSRWGQLEKWKIHDLYNHEQEDKYCRTIFWRWRP
jgi:hypothetical protein